MIFYRFKPADTLFFRGAEPMQMGVDHTATSVFPPPAHTVVGAIRTAYLKQHNIDFENYSNGTVEQKILDDIGKAGENAPFSLIGPLFKKDENYFIPAPYNWYIEKSADKESRTHKIITLQDIQSDLIVSHQSIMWAKGAEELMTIGGKWIDINALHANSETVDLFSVDDFVLFEERTGIAIEDDKKTVREGHLYSFKHARLHENVELVFGIDKEIDFAESGMLRLGAEQRFGSYKKVKNIFTDIQPTSEFFLSLSLVEGTNETNDAVVATGKIQYIGGWDLKKRFHKPMKGYFPAGTVFNKKLNNNFIQM